MTTTTGDVGARTVRVDLLTRVEGEGGLYLRLAGETVDEVRLDIFEPPRFFEAFLCGRSIEEVPDITARICGICPVAYQMSAAHALEAALRITISPEIRALRRLLYCAEWIQSHALHIYLLQAPDFLGYESAISLAADDPKLVQNGLDLKKAGNDLLDLLGGRASHPISVRVGGFYKAPIPARLWEIRGTLSRALELALNTAQLVSRFGFPSFEPDYDFVALVHPREYPMNEGEIGSSRGPSIQMSEYEKVFVEEQVPHSTSMHSVKAEGGTSYLVGPLARLNLNAQRLSPLAQEALKESGLTLPCRNPFKGIVARAIELVHACEEALSIIDSYVEPEPPFIEFETAGSQGAWATEAPRGLLYHRYAFDERGVVTFARIVPPTSQNWRRMEDDLRLLAPLYRAQSDEALAGRCEALVRCYDPCISCSTHFLKVKIDRS